MQTNHISQYPGERIAGQAVTVVSGKSFESLAKPRCSCSDPPVHSQHVTVDLSSTQPLSKLEYIPQNTPVFWELLTVNQAIQPKSSQAASELSMSRRWAEGCPDSHWTLIIIYKTSNFWRIVLHCWSVTIVQGLEFSVGHKRKIQWEVGNLSITSSKNSSKTTPSLLSNRMEALA